MDAISILHQTKVQMSAASEAFEHMYAHVNIWRKCTLDDGMHALKGLAARARVLLLARQPRPGYNFALLGRSACDCASPCTYTLFG